MSTEAKKPEAKQPARRPGKNVKTDANKPCQAMDVGHRSCPCPDCSHNAPKK